MNTRNQEAGQPMCLLFTVATNGQAFANVGNPLFVRPAKKLLSHLYHNRFIKHFNHLFIKLLQPAIVIIGHRGNGLLKV